MTQQNEPASAEECVALLQSVLRCLDLASHEAPRAAADAMALAAAHVQQAIELVQSVDRADP